VVDVPFCRQASSRFDSGPSSLGGLGKRDEDKVKQRSVANQKQCLLSEDFQDFNSYRNN
jgi:hypothetical protein